MKKIAITLDGKRVETHHGLTLLQLARAQGMDVPSLCYDPRLPPYASCFVCIVEVEGRRGVLPACATKAEDGMVVRTNTDNIRALRKLGLELLLSNHHGDCIAPCTMACPAGIDIRAYLSEAMRGNFSAALRIIKERNPFPSVCGRICPHPCEDNCRRTLVDEPVSINQVKRFIADRDRCSADAWKPDIAPKNGRKIAVLGGGPGGMSAAHYLATLGYSVTVFEAMEKAGGMLRYGVPDYRLPPAVLDSEIAAILDLGVELRTGKAWGRDFHLDDLRKEGYAAIVSAIGAWTGQSMGVEGEARDGVWSGIAMLERANRGEKPALGKRVAVVGGGNTAIDCARSALRLGADEVTIVYRRTRTEMPANPEEIQEAEDEGVKFLFLTAPTGFSGASPVTVRCVKMQLGAADASGRRRPEPLPGSETDIVADSVIAAIGQKVRWDGFDGDGLKLTRWGTPEADPQTLQSPSHPDVFVCGDCLNGPATAIEAIAGGRRAALSIHARLSGEPQVLSPHPFNIRKGALKELTPEEHAHYPKKPRTEVPQIDAFSRARTCDEVSHTLEEEKAVEEAGRCLLCGCQEVDTCLLRRYSGQYGATGEVYRGEKTHGLTMPEHPYIVRDHKKCILCGLCVRVCAELQGAAAIGLAGRGFVTEVASAWNSPLNEYACKSCGQCVAACPAGALSARFVKEEVPAWRAGSREAVCPYCGVGCVLDLAVADEKAQCLNNKIDGKPENALLCSRAFSGFDLLEMDGRLKEPLIKEKGRWRAAKWDEAMKAAADGLMNGAGKNAAVLASPRLSNEALYLLRAIAEKALKTPAIGAPGLGRGNDAVLRAFGLNASTAALDDILKADLIVAAVPGIETAYPSIAAAIREAGIKGARVVIEPSPAAHLGWLRQAAQKTPAAGREGFRALAAELKKAKGRVSAAAVSTADEIMAARRPLVIADPDLLSASSLEALCDLLMLAGRPQGLLLLRPASNAQGAIDLGFGGPVPLKAPSALLSWGDTGLAEAKLKGAFTVAAEWVAPAAKHPAAVVFPAALFSEDHGSFTSPDRRVRQAGGWSPAGAPQPNWKVLSDLARHLGMKTPRDIAALRKEISSAVPLYRGLGWEKWGEGRQEAVYKAKISPRLVIPAKKGRGAAPRTDAVDKFISARLSKVAFRPCGSGN